MIPNHVTKAAVVSILKANASLVAMLPDGTQGIREYGWRGGEFQYPNVRVEMETQIDQTPDSDCTPVSQTWSVYIFSESHSSQEADTIAGLIAQYFKGLSFDGAGVKFIRTEVLENIPAIPEDERTWRAQVRCRSIIHEI
jgi:hypothetical protein